jgi:hypothetical protein
MVLGMLLVRIRRFHVEIKTGCGPQAFSADLEDKCVLYHPVGDVLRRIQQRAADPIAALRMNVVLLLERFPNSGSFS